MRRLPCLLTLPALALLPGCSMVLPCASDAVVPPAWQGRNAWGPEADAARRRGELRDRRPDPRMAEWAAWGRQYLQDGDILLRLGEARTVVGLDFSRLAAHVSCSAFSHSGLAHWRDGTVWVYDTAKEGVRDQPFEVWLLDITDEIFAVHRLRPEYRDRIPAAVDYCRRAWLRQVPFDRHFAPDDDALYCVELTEKAYRHAGVELSEPIRICDLPNYHTKPLLRCTLKALSPIGMSNPVYVAGNDRFGLRASPKLELVYQTDAVAKAEAVCSRPAAPAR
ncbi:MAG TPA: YiiX/YebB-like N1pC/P60 family cysteine hydrolase [Gemmataceae bacterium]|nr:YiiX/YebB-like N1pC/P60 family cysteine hydrolase [Gemmataceae bacterium]